MFCIGHDFSRAVNDCEYVGLKSLRENSILSQGTTLRATEKRCFVSGHDFSRAEDDSEYCGLSP
jgi:hypothetical protein